MTAGHLESSVLRRHWNKLAQIAVWTMALLATFLMTPPRRTPAMEDVTWSRFAQFVLVIVLGLLVSALGRRRGMAKLCRRASTVFLVVGAAMFFINLRLIDVWTCEYDGHGPMVTGATLSSDAIQFKQKNPDISCSMLIQAFAGNTAQIWASDEISLRHAALIALYLLNVLCFSLSMVLMLESLNKQPPNGRLT